MLAIPTYGIAETEECCAKRKYCNQAFHGYHRAGSSYRYSLASFYINRACTP